MESFEQLNAMVYEWDVADDARRIGTRPHTIGEHFAVEQSQLAPLPDEEFETGTWLTPRVDRFSQVTVRTNRYSGRVAGEGSHLPATRPQTRPRAASCSPSSASPWAKSSVNIGASGSSPLPGVDVEHVRVHVHGREGRLELLADGPRRGGSPAVEQPGRGEGERNAGHTATTT